MSKEKEPECVKVQFELCGDALKRVRELQEDYYNKTGYHLSKQLAIIKLILEK